MTGSHARHLRRQAERRGATTTPEPLGAAANPTDGTTIASAVTAMRDSAGKPNSHSMSGGSIRESGTREKLVREAAYFRAERRGFTPGQELEDWFAAEREVDQLLISR